MTLRITIAQANFTVGDLAGNAEIVARLHAQAAAAGADLLVLTEMAITGYPPEDLVLRKGFQQQAMQTAHDLAKRLPKAPAILLGGLWAEGDALYNAAFLLEGGKIAHTQYKHRLPNYGVFDEKRVFAKGELPQPVTFKGHKLGVMICEDMWSPDVAAHHAEQGAALLISINASPYEVDKTHQRIDVARHRVQETGLPLIYVNQVGGQDELVFDGQSMALSASDELRSMLPVFAESDVTLTWKGKDIAGGEIAKPLNEEASIYAAMRLGLKDYVEKNRFPGVVLGLSGGIDSALTAAVAVDALGAERVRCVMMPSPYTSQESLDDAEHCAKLLGIRLDSLPITPAMEAFTSMLSPLFAGKAADTTEENIQSRIRGMLLMAVSNKEGALVLTTGNKSEMSVGYATLYGDMCGGYSVLKDLYKTTVYAVSRWRNSQGMVIPERVITKAPTAELKHNQTDQDTLPPYDMLDAILNALVEGQRSVEEIIAEGYDRATVTRVARMLYLAEYKRRQAPPGVKITGMAFGRDRRYPITSRWRV